MFYCIYFTVFPLTFAGLFPYLLSAKHTQRCAGEAGILSRQQNGQKAGQFQTEPANFKISSTLAKFDGTVNLMCSPFANLADLRSYRAHTKSLSEKRALRWEKKEKDLTVGSDSVISALDPAETPVWYVSPFLRRRDMSSLGLSPP